MNSIPNTNKSNSIFKKSSELIPGGVNSPVRAFKAVGENPFIVDKGDGPFLHDIDSRKYIDYVMSWGPLILGHSYQPVIEAINRAARSGTSFGAPTESELNLAAIVNERMPWIEKLRLVSSGTEACMTAIRIARGATGRDNIVKFDGGYHGHSDAFLIKAGSGLATGGLPSSGGVPENITKTTLSLPYNNIDAVKDCLSAKGERIAAVIVEPVAANMGVVPPEPGFLEDLRKLTSQIGCILIFDEVITGFRIAPGGAAEHYGIKPDLVCLGKILGGGLPIGGVGGSKELMDNLAPAGTVYQAGTLSGNPLSTAAGIATLKELADPNLYSQIKQYADDMIGAVSDLANRAGTPLEINQVESLFTLFFADHKIIDFESAQKADMNMYSEFFHHMLNQSIYLPPSGFEAWFVSRAHGSKQLALTIKAIKAFLNG
ncbi:MAG: glutamate-1-semialdehyde 2,1-aminomutase [candidate division Zixibacteria bacterium]|nr:glutamate-1-semialdehyde 2,1-aminomutase [candidate division Zixibacteria bacterium]